MQSTIKSEPPITDAFFMTPSNIYDEAFCQNNYLVTKAAIQWNTCELSGL